MQEQGLDGFYGQFYPGGVVVTAQVVANQNDWAPTGSINAAIILVNTDQPRSITGLAGGKKGRTLMLINNSTNVDGDVVLRAKSASSAAANRFNFDTDIVMETSEAVFLVYDHVNSFWTRGASRRYTGGTFRRNPYWTTDFLGPAGSATTEALQSWDVSLLSSGTQLKLAGFANHPGILRANSSATTNSGVLIATAPDAILLGGGERAEFVFKLPDLTTLTCRMGFFDTVTSADAVDGAYIEVASTGAAVAKTSNNSTRTTSANIAVLTANTWYLARVDVKKDLSGVDFYIFDDNGNQLGTQTNSANIPQVAGRETGHGIIGTKSGLTAQVVYDIDFMSLEFTRSLV